MSGASNAKSPTEIYTRRDIRRPLRNRTPGKVRGYGIPIRGHGKQRRIGFENGAIKLKSQPKEHVLPVFKRRIAFFYICSHNIIVFLPAHIFMLNAIYLARLLPSPRQPRRRTLLKKRIWEIRQKPSGSFIHNGRAETSPDG